MERVIAQGRVRKAQLQRTRWQPGEWQEQEWPLEQLAPRLLRLGAAGRAVRAEQTEMAGVVEVEATAADRSGAPERVRVWVRDP